LTQADVGHRGVSGLIPIEPGQAASYAVMSPPAALAFGAMSAGYGGSGESLTYTAEADFSSVSPGTWDYYVILDENNHTGAGFDSLEFQIDVDGINTFTFNTDSLGVAEVFFTNHWINLGYLAAGNQSIDLIYTLTASEVGAGFGFTYTVVPEASTWAMMLIGFAGLGFLGCRGSRRTAIV